MGRRHRRKNKELHRLAITGVLFLITVGILITVVLLQRSEQTKPQPQSTQQAQQTEGTAVPETQDADPQTVAAKAAVLFADKTFASKHISVYDATANVTLFEKSATERITAASTTKLLTALTMLDYVSADTVFTVGSEISLIGSGSSTAKLKKGYTLTTEQVLDMLLIPSGNDAAYVIAAHVGRILAKDPQISDKEAVALFVVQMNNKAKALGTVDSYFSCPDGYPDKAQYTTAADMMKIALAATKNETVRKTVGKVYVEYTMNDGTVLSYTNTNKLMVPSNSNFYEGLFGLKTGSTPAAGQCLIAGCEIYGHEVIIAVFKAQDDSSRWADCRVIIDTATEAITQAQKEYEP